MQLIYLSILTSFWYFVTSIGQTRHLLGKTIFPKWSYQAGSLIAIIGHGWILYTTIDTPLGQNLHWILMVSMSLWLMNIFTLLTSLKTKVENLCVFIYPLTLVSIVYIIKNTGFAVYPTKLSPQIITHVFLSLFAISILLLAAFQAGLMGVQNYFLKKHTVSPILKILPPLQSMENLLFHILSIGLIFLTCSLLSGIWQPELLQSPRIQAKLIFCGVSWALIFILFYGRKKFGFRGLTAVRLTFISAGFAWLAYLGTKFALHI